MIFSVPKSKYKDFYDIARYKLIWRICIVMLIFLPILAISQAYLEKMSAWPSIIGTFICIGLLLTLKITQSYIIPTIVFTVTGTLLSQYTYLLYPEAYHLNDTLWMIVIILFTFFTLGKIWGFIIIGANSIGVTYFISSIFNKNLNLITEVEQQDIMALSINFIICFFVIGYLINQFIITSKIAENQYRKLNHKLELSNAEKTTMLKEIHHRVKNNLQVITSLLRLQSHEIKDEDSKIMYKESINRVVAMALIHEKMYQSKNLAKIDLEEYINSLSQDLLCSYSVEKDINIYVNSEIENIKTKSLVPLALIFNELISNSIKHAFSSKISGEIKILIINNDTHITLEYSDNGDWKSTPKSNSFGLELIDSLTDQLSGKFERIISNGTHYNFVFAPER